MIFLRSLPLRKKATFHRYFPRSRKDTMRDTFQREKRGNDNPTNNPVTIHKKSDKEIRITRI